MDYYSKWVEVYRMQTNGSEEIAKMISDLITCFGFPVGILSGTHFRGQRDKRKEICDYRCPAAPKGDS
ncbi:hypothetical protein DPEC_G00251330 [Dallia pectoralis]|uniref:Uncharacterized protein n=1 Tax=Dallia pectoralis TaxID=75939 RepID=A0ACC2FTD0_DALPE|nr:hypothetical protein DPEC_G00251330 [Dallia pectoralis]